MTPAEAARWPSYTAARGRVLPSSPPRRPPPAKRRGRTAISNDPAMSSPRRRALLTARPVSRETYAVLSCVHIGGVQGLLRRVWRRFKSFEALPHDR